MDLGEIVVRPILSGDESRYQELMQQHHYLGALPKISETLWYVATWREEWVALLSFSASALKCAGRDRWIGWNFRQRYSRLKLVVNNSRFLILPKAVGNLGSRVLALCQRRLSADWQAAFGHGVLLLETFVDPARFRGTVYRAANWVYVGNTKGFQPHSPGVHRDTPISQDGLCPTPAGRCLSVAVPSRSSSPLSNRRFQNHAQRRADAIPPLVLSRDSRSPSRPGRRHGLSTVLGIAAGAVLCGMRGYEAIADWAQGLGPKARERFGCRRQEGRYVVPSESIIRNVLIRVDARAPGPRLATLERSPTRGKMKVWPSTARPCAMPWTRKVTPPM